MKDFMFVPSTRQAKPQPKREPKISIDYWRALGRVIIMASASFVLILVALIVGMK